MPAWSHHRLLASSARTLTLTAAAALALAGGLLAVSLLAPACGRRPPPSPGGGAAPPGAGESFDHDFGITNRATQAIIAVAEQRQKAVLNRDRRAFLDTTDPENATYLVEQRHWFDDASRTVESFSLRVHDVHLKSRDEAVVSMSQTFRLKDGGERSYDYEVVYRRRGGQWKDSDYVFDEVRRDGVVVRHQFRPRLAQAALNEEQQALDWLRQTFGWQPSSEVVIKVYPEHVPFLYSIKPSLPDWVAGWNEAGEAVKIDAPRDDPRLRPGVLLHETTHRMLSELTNDNASYWLQEGLATWAVQAESGAPSGTAKSGSGRAAPRWTLQELETQDLESMDGEKAAAYYAETLLVVRYLMDAYGIDKFKAVAVELGRHPYNPVTAAEKTAETNRLTRQAIEQALGVPFDQFARSWYAWAKAQPDSGR